MWLPDSDKLIKIRLHDQGEEIETVWAVDLGPADSDSDSRRVQIGNIPFLHAKPTYEDVLLVSPSPDDGMLEWDREGMAYDDIGGSLLQDNGRWAMIIDYQPGQNDTLDAAFQRIDLALQKCDVAVEGAFANEEENSGRAYLAVPDGMGVDEVMVQLASPNINAEVTLIHPVDD